MITRGSRGGEKKKATVKPSAADASSSSPQSKSLSTRNIVAEKKTKTPRKNISKKTLTKDQNGSASSSHNNENDGMNGDLDSAAVEFTDNETTAETSPIKSRLVGGPLVGLRQSKHLAENSNLPSSWRYFKPLITPLVGRGPEEEGGGGGGDMKQRFILLPHQHYITVLAYKTGTKIATLVPNLMRTSKNKKQKKRRVGQDDENGDGEYDNDTVIESVCLARGNHRNHQHYSNSTSVQDDVDRMDVDSDNEDETTSNEKTAESVSTKSGHENDVLVLVGCQDSTIREFSLLELVQRLSSDVAVNKEGRTTPSSVIVKCDGYRYELAGPYINPRRIISVPHRLQSSIIHLAVPDLDENMTKAGGDGSMWVYCLMESPAQEEEESKEACEEGGDEKKKTKNTAQHAQYADVTLHRLIVPPFDGALELKLKSASDLDDDDAGDYDNTSKLLTVSTLSQNKCRVDSSPNLGSRYTRTVPFQMTAVTRRAQALDSSSLQTQNGVSIFVIVAKADALTIYHDHLTSRTSSSSSLDRHCRSFPATEYPFQDKNQLTAIDVSLNKSDVTCGHRKGHVCVMNNVLTQVELHNWATFKEEARQLHHKTIKQNHTSRGLPPKVIVSKAHWHAHPVSSVTYDVKSSFIDPLLYSGGDESVMVTWQTSQGRDRPADVLPRLALGGVVHLVMSSSNRRVDSDPASGVLVHCEDNSIQLIESHNKSRIWKIHGLAASKKERNIERSKSPTTNIRDVRIEPDPRSGRQRRSQLVVTGLADAPGHMHWFDPISERVLSKLEVAPFNRISRTEPDEMPLPTPWVTNHAFSGNGSTMITIDEASTENSLIGVYEQRNGDEYGVVPTIRFWAWNDDPMPSKQSQRSAWVPYKQIASMTYPHGPKNRVDALALSKDGLTACTVSNSEKVFLIWEKDSIPSIPGSTKDEEDDDGEPTDTWSCRFKVSVPSGFSNFSTPCRGVAFSTDGSVLAVAFGQLVTLWDPTNGQLLSSFQHGDRADIEQVQFVDPGLHRDILLVHSKTGVSLWSSHGECGSTASLRAWSWSLSKDAKCTFVSAVEVVDSHNGVAVSIYDEIKDRSQVVLLDVETGTLGIGDSDSNSKLRGTNSLRGQVVHLAAVGKPNSQSGWDTKPKRFTPFLLYAMMSSSELILLNDLKDAPSQAPPTQLKVSRRHTQSNGPRLNIRPTESLSGQKRRLDAVSFVESKHGAHRLTKRMALGVFGITTPDETKNASTTSKDLPSLSLNFIRKLVGRNLSSK